MKKPTRLGLTWVGPTAVAFLLYLALVLRAGAGDGFHFYGPIRVGDVYAVSQDLLPGMRASHGTGYDGQMYFFLAQDPFLRHPWTAGSLDSSFRYRRLLYPLLAWALTLGNRTALPLAMILINLACCTGVIALCARAAVVFGRSPWSALALAAFAGIWIPLLLDLTEPLQLVLLTAGVLASSAALLLLSSLAKETSAVVLGTEMLRAVIQRRWRSALFNGGALAFFAGWSAFVQVAVHGARYLIAAPPYLAPPGAPFVALVIEAHQSPAALLITGPAVGICVLALVRLRVARDGAAWGAAAYSLICLGTNLETWLDPVGIYRIMAGSVVLAYLSWCRTGDREGWAINALGAAAGVLSLGAVLTA